MERVDLKAEHSVREAMEYSPKGLYEYIGELEDTTGACLPDGYCIS